MHNNSISDIIKKRTRASVPTLIYLSLKNFVSYKLRSLLTVLGVIIGTVAVFFLASFGIGVHDLVSQQIVGEKSLKVIDVASPNSKILRLNDTLINTIKQYPHVEKVGLQFSFPGVLSIKSGESDTVVYGIDENFQELSSLNLLSGSYLDMSDKQSAMVSSSALKSLGFSKSADAIGKDLSLVIPIKRYSTKADKISGTFKIIGVVESDSDSEVYLPSYVFSLAGVSTYNEIKVKAETVDSVTSVRKQVEANGLETSSLVDTMQEINNIFKFLNWILIGFGSIGTIVAVLGMFNTLTISLVERTKEIGLMMSLGARRVDVRHLFMLDSVIMSVVGSSTGVSIAYFAGKVVNHYINIGAKSRGVTESFSFFATPLWLIGSVILATTLIGLIIAYWPARRASKINPIDALRHE